MNTQPAMVYGLLVGVRVRIVLALSGRHGRRPVARRRAIHMHHVMFGGICGLVRVPPVP